MRDIRHNTGSITTQSMNIDDKAHSQGTYQLIDSGTLRWINAGLTFANDAWTGIGTVRVGARDDDAFFGALRCESTAGGVCALEKTL